MTLFDTFRTISWSDDELLRACRQANLSTQGEEDVLRYRLVKWVGDGRRQLHELEALLVERSTDTLTGRTPV